MDDCAGGVYSDLSGYVPGHFPKTCNCPLTLPDWVIDTDFSGPTTLPSTVSEGVTP